VSVSSFFGDRFFLLWLTAELLTGTVFACRENSVFNGYSHPSTLSDHLHSLTLRKSCISTQISH
ncbi:MAG: hypothetical protein SPI30_03200, partial [Prevotella sp.]|nr:hypothetical protein [Prevotella sp.]